jgi:thioredoxin-like negative regulator of GroEL
MKRLVLAAAWLTAAAAAVAGAPEALPYEDILSPDAACRDACWAGVEAIGAEDAAAARAAFEAAAARDPKCFVAWVMLSGLAAAAGDRELAATYVDRIPAEPPEVNAGYDRITAALREDDWAGVAARAGELIRAYPQTVTAISALHLLARAQYYGGSRDEAYTTLRAAYMYSDLVPGTVPTYASQAEANELELFAGRR